MVEASVTTCMTLGVYFEVKNPVPWSSSEILVFALAEGMRFK
jgi:hypothetical protein